MLKEYQYVCPACKGKFIAHKTWNVDTNDYDIEVYSSFYDNYYESCPDCGRGLELESIILDIDKFEMKEIVERRLSDLLNKSLEAWKILVDCESDFYEVRKYFTKLPEDLIEAEQHLYSSYSQEINGFRDHIKMFLRTEE